MPNRRCAFLAATISCLSVGWCAAAEQPGRPNVVLILVDDMGFSDLGCFGSEIETPNLDRLASHGLRLTQFYNTAKCHSSRISLLTGRYPFQAGNTSLDRAVTIAEVLGKAGYFTAMTGKWHLGRQPTEFGFDRYFGHLSGSCNYYLGDDTFRLNGARWNVPPQGFYTTGANVDHAIRFLDEARTARQPWFLYVAFNAPHAPLQPLERDYRKYLGRYDAGWDVARAARVHRQTELNLFGKPVEPSPRPDHVSAWEALPAEEQRQERRRMAAYAALIDRIDQELGRLVGNLEQHHELDNTLLLFCSDNGACPFGRRPVTGDAEPFDPSTHWGDSTGWAWMRNSPFRLYKQNQHEGGIASPAIVHWPAGLKTPGAVCDSPAHLVDVLPTLAEVARAELPAEWPGRSLSPVAGISLVPLLRGGRPPERPPIHLQFGKNRALRDGDWKIVSFRGNPWELYRISEDRTELNDLASQSPDVVERLSRQWDRMSAGELLLPERFRLPVGKKPQPITDPDWINTPPSARRP